MITEAMVIKGLACIGAYTVANKTIVPAAGFVGNKIGMGVGALASKLNKRGKKNYKEKAKVDEQANEQAIMALLAECNEVFSENDTKEEPDNVITIVEEVKPEPMFDQKTQNWIQHCKDQYGGFANIVLN